MTEITKDEFCARFVARMMASMDRYDGSEAELREYAEHIAPTYWDDPNVRVYGPEECASTDISYWEE